MKLIKVKCADAEDKLIVITKVTPNISFLVYKVAGKDLYRFEVTGPQLHYFDREKFTSKDKAVSTATEYAKKAAKKLHR